MDTVKPCDMCIQKDCKNRCPLDLTALRRRITEMQEDGWMPFGKNDGRMILLNAVRNVGSAPTDDELLNEFEIFYNG